MVRKRFIIYDHGKAMLELEDEGGGDKERWRKPTILIFAPSGLCVLIITICLSGIRCVTPASHPWAYVLIRVRRLNSVLTG